MAKKKTADPVSASRHSIAVVSRRTGVSQLLLRAWERRYNAVAPERTPTGRRQYSDQDLEKLTLLHLLTKAGYRIGDIARHGLADLRELAGDIAVADFATPAANAGIGNAEEFLAQALEATANLDAHRLEAVLERALLGLSKPILRSQLLVPLLVEIGERWSAGRMRVAHEHMASSVIGSFLSNLNARQPVLPGAPLMVVATPSGQIHELGALLSSSVALESGWDVLYLGRDLPAEDIAVAAHERGARGVMLSLVFPLNDPAIAGQIRQLRRLLGVGMAIVVGGRAAPSYAEVLSEVGARTVADDSSLVALLSDI